MTDKSPAFRAHPWHGVSIGKNAPQVVNVYVEIVPSDTVKYEIDKESGILKIDRPQLYSNRVPALYGFIPQTYCGSKIGALCDARMNRKATKGDGDPLDILVLTEQQIPRGDILIEAKPIGGLTMIDGEEADDKIIAVLKDDAVYGGMTEIGQCPALVLERLRHYFLTYKAIPGQKSKKQVELGEWYPAADSHNVIQASQVDYRARAPN